MGLNLTLLTDTASGDRSPTSILVLWQHSQVLLPQGMLPRVLYLACFKVSSKPNQSGIHETLTGWTDCDLTCCHVPDELCQIIKSQQVFPHTGEPSDQQQYPCEGDHLIRSSFHQSLVLQAAINSWLTHLSTNTFSWLGTCVGIWRTENIEQENKPNHLLAPQGFSLKTTFQP